jgi:branched-chain amino acid transport system substrate-binding protein
VLAALKKKYPEIKSLADVTPAVGIANAYDAMHLTALAITKAGSTDGTKIRDAFYNVDKYDGLIKSYAKPFTKANHDALGPNDYIFTYFKEGEILPLTN